MFFHTVFAIVCTSMLINHTVAAAEFWHNWIVWTRNFNSLWSLTMSIVQTSVLWMSHKAIKESL